MTALIKQINPTTKAKKQSSPMQERPFDFPIYKILFAELIKLVYDKPIIYKRYTTRKTSS